MWWKILQFRKFKKKFENMINMFIWNFTFYEILELNFHQIFIIFIHFYCAIFHFFMHFVILFSIQTSFSTMNFNYKVTIIYQKIAQSSQVNCISKLLNVLKSKVFCFSQKKPRLKIWKNIENIAKHRQTRHL